MKKTCPLCQTRFDQEVNFCLQCGSILEQRDETVPAQTADEIVNCNFRYKCPLEWEKLERSADQDVRFCSSCHENVYFAHSQNELDRLAIAGKCVAFHPNGKMIFTDPRQFTAPPLMGMIMPNDFPVPPPPERPEPEKKAWWQFWK